MAKPAAHQSLPTAWAERDALRDKGQFWTPDWVADAMIAYVAAKADVVFDPAVGRGAFLEAVLRSEACNMPFIGSDVDKEVLLEPVFRRKSVTVEVNDFLAHPPSRRFPAIVGNPPYIRHHRLSAETKARLKKLSAAALGKPLDGRAGYHVYFLIQALQLLQESGRLAFIMPSDTCEGVFARPLWEWISTHFAIDAVCTFTEDATPFPGVDTNAIVFFIRNATPKKSLVWMRATEAHSTAFRDAVRSDFSIKSYPGLVLQDRPLHEAIATGLSRLPQSAEVVQFRLGNFARVVRGIATGSNDFFHLTQGQLEALALPPGLFKRAIGRTRDASGERFTDADLQRLEAKGRPTYLLSIKRTDALPPVVEKYLRAGEAEGLAQRALIKQRSPWYKMEQREVPPLLFAYLGRRSVRFIRNDAAVLPLTGFLCVYPIYSDEEYIESLWKALNHPDTLASLPLVGKSYGSGAIKVEPRSLLQLPIAAHIVEKYGLARPYVSDKGQLEVFREPDE